MMHQRDQWMARTQRRGGLRQYPEGEAVDHDRITRPQRRKSCAGRGAGRGGGIRKPVAEVDDLDAPIAQRKLRDDAAVVDIAPGRGRKIARHREGGAPYHNGASYQARASSAATAARNSKRCLVKNSVVVLVPLNCG